MSEVDWTKAPDGAEFYANGYFYKQDAGSLQLYCKGNDWWEYSEYGLGDIIAQYNDYEPRPQQWPKSDERYVTKVSDLDEQRIAKAISNALLLHKEHKSSIDFLDMVKNIQEQRAAEYEQEGGERSFDKIATVFNTYTGKDLLPSDIALILEILKNVRFYAQDGYHSDSVVDKVSYGSLWAELVTKERT